MRKARDPELTPCSIRIWQQLFDTYTQHPTRLMNAIEAVGERSYAALKFLYPDVPPPIDERAFEPYLKRLFTNPTNLFSEIREATAKTKPRTTITTIYCSYAICHCIAGALPSLFVSSSSWCCCCAAAFFSLQAVVMIASRPRAGAERGGGGGVLSSSSPPLTGAHRAPRGRPRTACWCWAAR